MKLGLSTFCNGIDIFGEAFKKQGFCIVQAGDIKFGQDIRDFHAPKGKFDIVIGGTCCQNFSGLNRNPDFEAGMSLIKEFCRVVMEADPDCWIMENVARVPDIPAEWVEGYEIQRFNLSPRECGEYAQIRNRSFQFGFKTGQYLDIKRDLTWHEFTPLVTASEGGQTGHRTFSEVCVLQGLPADFEIEGFTNRAKFDAVGNAVHFAVGSRIAQAICERSPLGTIDKSLFCKCTCGRRLEGKQKSATEACRKRVQKRKLNVNTRGWYNLD